jgi:hypothetical protein
MAAYDSNFGSTAIFSKGIAVAIKIHEISEAHTQRQLRGCAEISSHSGLINTLLYATQLIGMSHFSLVIGGTHLIAADDLYLKKTEEHLKDR